MKIHLRFGDQVVSATLVESEAALAFIAMLPLTITMHNIFGREKFGALPSTLGHAPVHSQGYQVGDLICWSAGPDLAVMHTQDHLPLCGGFHVLGHIAEGAELFAEPGPLDIVIDRETGPVVGCSQESSCATSSMAKLSSAYRRQCSR